MAEADIETVGAAGIVPIVMAGVAFLVVSQKVLVL
jgi:hypothetical protein